MFLLEELNSRESDSTRGDIMTDIGERFQLAHHDFMVFMGRQKLTFGSFEDAIEALERRGIIGDDRTAKDVLERRAVPECAEVLETWP
jgi:hypothetical protein